MACKALHDLWSPLLSAHLSLLSQTLARTQAPCLGVFALVSSFAWNALPTALHLAHTFPSLQLKCYLYQKWNPLLVTFPWTCHVQRHFHLPHAPRLCGLVPNWTSRLQNSPPWLESVRDSLLPSASHSGLFTIWTLLTSPTSSPGAPSYINKVFPKLPHSS